MTAPVLSTHQLMRGQRTNNTAVICANCGNESEVTDTDYPPGAVRRRRQCLSLECGARWSTWETRHNPKAYRKFFREAVKSLLEQFPEE